MMKHSGKASSNFDNTKWNNSGNAQSKNRKEDRSKEDYDQYATGRKESNY